MKRIILCLLTIGLYAIANAQIQTKFWGLELSKHYSSLNQVREIISDRCDYAIIDGDSIIARVGSFGGYDWSHIMFGFYNEYNTKALYSVIFLNTYSTRASAKDRYDSLFNALSNKYGTPEDIGSTYDDFRYRWSDEDSNNSCLLRLNIEEAIGGNLCWCVCISYLSHDYAELASEQDEDEL